MAAFPERFTLLNPEVFFAPDEVLFSKREDIDFLKQRAALNPRRRIRLCTHANTDELLHEMLILHHRDVYVPPHCHIGKAESFHIIEGEALVMMLDDTGSVVKAVEMGPPESGKPFYYRIPAKVWHSFIIRSEWLVFHEVTEGPFIASQNIAAPFAADQFGDAGAIWAYVSELEKRALAHLAGS